MNKDVSIQLYFVLRKIYNNNNLQKKNSVTKMLNKPVNGFNFVLVEHSDITVYHPY